MVLNPPAGIDYNKVLVGADSLVAGARVYIILVGPEINIVPKVLAGAQGIGYDDVIRPLGIKLGPAIRIERIFGIGACLSLVGPYVFGNGSARPGLVEVDNAASQRDAVAVDDAV
jgi:hypothetical protein